MEKWVVKEERLRLGCEVEKGVRVEGKGEQRV